MSRIEECLKVVLKSEGGFSDHPKDPGGRTMMGVTQRVYDSYRRRRKLAAEDVANITHDEVVDIYRKQYWNAIHGDELPVGIDMVTFDFAVNSGPKQAARVLQRALGMRLVDGHIGEATIAAAEDCDVRAVVADMMKRRRGFLKRLKTFRHFGRGWMTRCDYVEKCSMGSIALVEAERVEAVAPAAQAELIPTPTPASVVPAPVAEEAVLQAKPAPHKAEPPPANKGVPMTALLAAVGSAATVFNSTADTVGTAVAKVGAGASSAEKVIATGSGITSNPIFWLACVGAGFGLYIWLKDRERVKHLLI